MFCFDQGSPVVWNIGASLEDLQEEEDNGPDDNDHRGDVRYDVEARIGSPFDKNTAVEVDDAELDEAVGWYHDHIDYEFDLV